MSSLVPKRCIRCDAPYEVRACVAARSQFCGRACHRAYRRETARTALRPCVTCGKPFLVKPCAVDEARFCSRACRKQCWEKPCAICGKPITVTPSTAAKRVCCSRACASVYRYGQRSREPNWRCVICGAERHVTPFWLERKKCCSEPCRKLWLSLSRRGEKGTNWKGGMALIARYIRSSNTMKNWIADVLAAAEGQCAECEGQAEHVHHVLPVSELLAKLFALENGRALCVACHAVQPNHNEHFVRRPPQAAQQGA